MEEYAFHEYPKALYRDRPKGSPEQPGGWVENPPFEAMIVNDEAEEIEAVDAGWRNTPEAAQKAAPKDKVPA